MGNSNRIDWLNLFFLAATTATVLLGMIFFWLGGQISHLICERQATELFDCQLEKQFFGLFVINTQTLNQISEASVQEDCFDSCRYWVEIQTEGGPARFTRFSSFNRAGVTADQAQVNRYLNDQRLNTFDVSGKPSLALFLSGIPLVSIGGVLLFTIIKQKRK